jgi:hypothetical protein
LEISHTGNGWHPHLHIICDCEWLSLETPPPKPWWNREDKAAAYQGAAAEVSREWAQCAKQCTSNVYIQRVKTGARAEKATKEQIKYTLKGEDLVKCKGRASELIDAMKSVRLYRGFGNCFRVKVEDKVERTPCPCSSCGCIQWEPEECEQRREWHRK